MSICDGCGLPAGNTYPSRHLALFLFWTCTCSTCWHQLFQNCRDFSDFWLWIFPSIYCLKQGRSYRIIQDVFVFHIVITFCSFGYIWKRIFLFLNRRIFRKKLQLGNWPRGICSWLYYVSGNKYVRISVNCSSEVYFKLQGEDGSWSSERNKDFAVADEQSDYKLTFHVEPNTAGNPSLRMSQWKFAGSFHQLSFPV